MGLSSPDEEAYDGDFSPWDEGFDDASIDDLKSAIDVDSSETEAVYNYSEEKQRAKIARLKGENEMRRKFFAWSSKLAGWMVGANFVIFTGYLAIQAWAPGKISDAVIGGWIGATVVEILGIVAIIARHLFPGKKWQNGNGMKH